MSDTRQHVQPAPNAHTDVSLDGGWFRRERERVALGRKRVAERLGITESRLSVLESRKQPVPSEWMPILAELEFRVPSAPKVEAAAPADPPKTEAHSRTEPVVAQPAEPEKAVVPPPVEPVVSVPAEKTPTAVETPAAVVPAAVAPAAVVPAAVVPAVVAPNVETPSAEPAVTKSAPVSSASSSAFFCGHWLRERRLRSAKTTQQLASQLGCSETELSTLEQYNLRLPTPFVSRLHKVSLLSKAEVKAALALPSTTRFDGIWLSRQRTALRMSQEQLGQHLNASEAALKLVEEKSWHVPQEWLQVLATLQKTSGQKSTETAVQRRSFGGPPRRLPAPPAPRPPVVIADKPKASAAVSTAKDAPIPTAVKSDAASRATTGPAVDSKTVPTKSASPAVVRDPNLGTSVVEGRIGFGKRAGLSANDVLALIAHDLLLAKVHVPLSYDAVAAAMRVLLSHRSGAA